MAPRNAGPTRIAELITQRHPDAVFALRDALGGPGREPGAPVARTHQAMSVPRIRVTLVASTMRLNYDPRTSMTEQRVSVSAVDRTKARVGLPSAEAEGWARAVFGDLILPFVYRHTLAIPSVIAELGVERPATHFVAFHDGANVIPVSPTLPYAAELSPIVDQ